MKIKISNPSNKENWILKLLIILGLFSLTNFIFYFLNFEHVGNIYLFSILCISIFYGVFKKLYLWYNYSNISVPKKPENYKEYSVDVLTTYYPGEPYQMIVSTLEAIQKITYPHTAYLCDEANDPFLKKFCEDHDVIHVTRDNRINAKAGNINNALRTKATGEICVILDPDHIPEPNFLDEVIPYFANPEIGFVQTVQAYYNIKESLVAQGAAEQTFQFYGPMMMTLNSYGAVNAIGANCVFRRSALDSIGGHAPGLCEDMHTAMQIYAEGWKAVYVPVILARGLSPSNLTDFFKQQLKWSRGTFDLLFNVYPKLFTKLTVRQKIHFAVLPLHYLSGLICLINFLIPIISLLFSITPWKGDFLDFAITVIPVIFSSILIRTYIQKWVIEKKERGFHLVGGLLQINTWWINILGFFYTLINKKIPYLPTPKESEHNTNLKIVIPNIGIGILSILAIVIGLRKDFTPFSLLMAGFAFFNMLIMFFGVYLSLKSTNENNILKNTLNRKSLIILQKTKSDIFKFFNSLFNGVRKSALPLLFFILLFSLSFKFINNEYEWDNVQTYYPEKISSRYNGIFYPSAATGTSDYAKIQKISKEQSVDFDIISLYIGWDNTNTNFPEELMDSIIQNNQYPLITWEPWPMESLKNSPNVLKDISEGYYDPYIIPFAQKIAALDHPVFLKFAHEYNNPGYPWSKTTGDLSSEYKAAWIHVYELLHEYDASKTIMVWNPWNTVDLEEFYPGDAYVDWIGLTLLNYGKLNHDGKSRSFSELYIPFRDSLAKFTNKPIMLAEFGSINQNKAEWLMDAKEEIKKAEEIHAVIHFNSSFDANIPEGKYYDRMHLDWTSDSLNLFSSNEEVLKQEIVIPEKIQFERNELPENIKGVWYKKANNWRHNYYVPTRETILHDFRIMENSGINTVALSGGNIYDYNLLKFMEDEDFQLLYTFEIDYSLNYITDEKKLSAQRQDILDRLDFIIKQKNLTAISFNFQLSNHYIKPMLFEQQRAYIDWLQPILETIKSKNSFLPITINLNLDAETESNIKLLDRFLPVDAYGLIYTDDKEKSIPNIEDLNSKYPVFISSISSEKFLDEPRKFADKRIVFENWQNEKLSNRLSFDGLLDFEGNKKRDLLNIAKSLKGQNVFTQNYSAKILKPAVPLQPGAIYTYYALVNIENQWVYPNEQNELEFEWSLIKTDDFGNPVALKKLGNGPTIDLKIPENYEQYKLHLNVIDKKRDYSIMDMTLLNTPAETE